MHHMRTDVDQRNVLVAAVRRQRRSDHLESFLRGVGLDIHHPRFEAGGLGNRHPVLDFFLARSRNQYLDLVGVVRRRTEDLEIQIDLVQGERDVLIGLSFDLELEFFLGLPGWNDDFLGDDHRRRKREGDVPVARAQSLVRSPQRLADLVKVGDVAVGDYVLGQRLDRIAFQAVCALAGFGQLHQLERRRADIDPDQRGRCRLQERKSGTEFFLQHRRLGAIHINYFKS